MQEGCKAKRTGRHIGGQIYTRRKRRQARRWNIKTQSRREGNRSGRSEWKEEKRWYGRTRKNNIGWKDRRRSGGTSTLEDVNKEQRNNAGTEKNPSGEMEREIGEGTNGTRNVCTPWRGSGYRYRCREATA